MDNEDVNIPWKPASTRYEPTVKHRREQLVLRPFEDEQERQENARLEHKRIQLLATIHMRDKRHNLIYNVFHKRWQEARLKAMYDFALHASLLDSWKNLEQEDSMSILSLDNKEGRMKASEKVEESSDIFQEIEIFERKGYELGADSKSTTPEVKVNDEKANSKLKETKTNTKVVKGAKKKQQDILESSLKTVDPVLLVQQGKAYYEEVKVRIDKKAQERFEKIAKHEQELVEQLQRQKDLEDILRNQKEAESYREKKEEELRKIELLMMGDAEQQSLNTHRKLFQKKMREQRNNEWNAVLARDHELLLMMQQDHAKSLLREKILWQEEKHMKAVNKRKKHTKMCTEIISQIVQLCEDVALYKENIGNELSEIEWYEWKRLFVKGAILPSPFGDAITITQIHDEDATMANEEAVMDYIEEKGEWSQPILIGKNKDLGSIISQLHYIANGPFKLPKIHLSSNMKLKLSVVGPPFSGKTTVAKKLANELGILHIEVDKVLTSTLAISGS